MIGQKNEVINNKTEESNDKNNDTVQYRYFNQLGLLLVTWINFNLNILIPTWLCY